MGAFCCHGHQSFDPICLKTLCCVSPPPVMLHIKSDQDWPTGLRDIQVRKCIIFVIQGQVTPKWVVWSGPKSNSCKFLCLSWLSATLRMIRSKLTELAWRQHYKSMGNFLDAQGWLTPQSVVWSSQNSSSSKILCMSSLPANTKKDRIKTQPRKGLFSPFKVNGGFLLPWKPEFCPICPKPLCSLSPTPVMLHIKFDQDWPTGFRDIQIWKCGWQLTTDDDGPLASAQVS